MRVTLVNLELCNLLWGVIVLMWKKVNLFGCLSTRYARRSTSLRFLRPHCTSRTTSRCIRPHCARSSTSGCLGTHCANFTTFYNYYYYYIYILLLLLFYILLFILHLLLRWLAKEDINFRVWICWWELNLTRSRYKHRGK